MTGFESVSEIDIAAPPTEVWAALTDGERFGRAMFGTEVVTLRMQSVGGAEPTAGLPLPLDATAARVVR